MDTDNWGIIGHEWAVRLLSGQLARQRAAHAYLFTGMPGIGKTLLATRLAQAMNCVGDIPPCGACRPCRLIAHGGHPDFLVVEAEGRSIKIEQMRDLQGALALRPFEARYRVALILRAHEATEQAADALLKTLEEPPPSARLLLTADLAESLLPTIVSRCQVIALRPVPTHQIERALAAIAPERAALLARLSSGRPGWAITAAHSPDLLTWREQVLDGAVAILHANRIARFRYAEELAARADLEQILDIWQAWWRDVVLLAEGSRVEPVNIDRATDLEKVAPRIGPKQARQALQAVCNTVDALKKNANTRLALDVMLLDMPYP